MSELDGTSRPIKGTSLRYSGAPDNDLPFGCRQCRRTFPDRKQLAEWDAHGYRCAECAARADAKR